MNNQDRVQRAIEYAQAACRHDANHEYPAALDMYKRTLDNFQLLYKYEQNPLAKEEYKKKLTQYLTRAEEIKKCLKEGQKVPQAAGDVGENKNQANKGNTGGQDGGHGNENAQLRASLQNTVLAEVPNVHWDDIGGLEGAKSALKEALIFPQQFANAFSGKLQPWRGVLLYGPPGTGKTHLARACATEVKSKFFAVSSSDIMSRWVGESEAKLKEVFAMAREEKRAIIFIDEIDSICRSRRDGDPDHVRRVLTEFLNLMDGIHTSQHNESSVFVLGATNTPWDLDQGVRRRFERRVYIPLPDIGARKAIFNLEIGSTVHSLSPEQVGELVERTEGYSGSDIKSVTQNALMQPVHKLNQATHLKQVRANHPLTGVPGLFWMPCSPGDPDPTRQACRPADANPDELLPPRLVMMDFETALSNVRPSLNAEDLKRYDKC
eukprot:Selendium_serpulae@DN5754_c2_g1_i1.p1